MPAEASFGTGILVVLVGAFANGSFGLMSYVRRLRSHFFA